MRRVSLDERWDELDSDMRNGLCTLYARSKR